MKKFLSLALALAMVMGIGFEAFADSDVVEGSGSTDLTITAAATQLSATVPTSLAIAVDSSSDATVGTGHITNNSYGIIQVTNITLSDGTYELAAYSNKATFMRYDVGSRKLGLSIAFGGDTVETLSELTGSAVTYVTGTDFSDDVAKEVPNGTLKIGALNNGVNSNTLKIEPSALVSPTGSTAIRAEDNEVAASMVIVLGWYTGSGS